MAAITANSDSPTTLAGAFDATTYSVESKVDEFVAFSDSFLGNRSVCVGRHDAFGYLLLTMKDFLPFNPVGTWKPGFSGFSGPYQGCRSPFGDQWADFRLYRGRSPVGQRRHPDQVVTRKDGDGLRRRLRQANMPNLARAADGLCPTNDFLDRLTFLEDGCITDVPGRPAINGRPGSVRLDLECDLALTHCLHGICNVIAFVRAQRAAVRHATLDHVGRRFPLRGATCLHRFDIDRQAPAVLRQPMPRVAEPGLVAFAFLEDLGFRIRRRAMGVIAALFAPRSCLRLPAACRAILRNKALVGNLGVDQRTIDRGMRIGGQFEPVRRGQDPAEGFPHDGFGKQPLPDFGEGRCSPHFVIQREADGPAVQAVVLDALHPLPFRADGRQDRRETYQPGTEIQMFEGRVHRHENAIDQRPELTLRTVCWDPLFQTPVAEHRRLNHIGPSHRFRYRSGNARIIPLAFQGQGF